MYVSSHAVSLMNFYHLCDLWMNVNGIILGYIFAAFFFWGGGDWTVSLIIFQISLDILFLGCLKNLNVVYAFYMTHNEIKANCVFNTDCLLTSMFLKSF